MTASTRNSGELPARQLYRLVYFWRNLFMPSADTGGRMIPRLAHIQLVLSCVVPLLWASTGRAQPFGKTAIATVHVGTEASSSAAAAIEAELAARRTPLISLHEARDRFLAASRPPQGPTATDLEALSKEAKQAVEHVAFGRAAAAEKSVREIIALAERSLETLNRQTLNARQLLDACLALVRSSLHEGQRQVAVEQAMGCRRLVPDLPPSESAHPAAVVGVLAEADDELRRMRVGSLTVRNVPARPCSVYLNGRHLGTTPFELDRAAVGTYRVQVECDEKRAGRVHVVTLGDQPVELEVDTSFDEAVTTEPRIGLSYPTTQQLRSRLVGHATRLGRTLRAEDMVVLRDVGGRIELLRVNVKRGLLIGATDLEAAVARNEVAVALDVLAQGRFRGVEPDAYASGTVSSADSMSARNVAETAQHGTSGHPPPIDKPRPIYKKWWLWATVGVVVVGGVVAGVLLGTRGSGNHGPEEPTIDVPDSM